jgi:hypothetical protein
MVTAHQVVSATSLQSFDDAVSQAFAQCRAIRRARASQRPDVHRLRVTNGGNVGVPQVHAELRITDRRTQAEP